MNKTNNLYDLVIESFIKNGYEISFKSSFITTVQRWKLIHKSEDIKVVETSVNIILDETEGAEQVLVRYSYYDKE